MEEDVIVTEPLPFKYGHYCATFVGFHRDIGAELTFCCCQSLAIHNQLEMSRRYETLVRGGSSPGWYVIAHRDYPTALWNSVPTFERLPIRAVRRFMKLEPGLCHRCNQRMPYGFYGYSGVPSGYFISHFRPYVNQECYRLGFTPTGSLVLPEFCPENLQSATDEERMEFAESETRKAFGFPPKGINRNQESRLFLLVRHIFPDARIVRNYRPAWLEGLELDIFVEDKNFAVEFQGVQHSQPFGYLGGEAGLRRTKKRDKRKAELCKQHGVNLVLIEEGTELTDHSIRARFRKVLPDVALNFGPRIERPPFCFFIGLENGKSRWTYHHEKHELSVVADVGESHLYNASPDFDVVGHCEGETITFMRFSGRKRDESFSLTLPVTKSASQSVHFGRPSDSKPLLEFLKVWSMFYPRVRMEQIASSQCRTAPAA